MREQLSVNLGRDQVAFDNVNGRQARMLNRIGSNSLLERAVGEAQLALSKVFRPQLRESLMTAALLARNSLHFFKEGANRITLKTPESTHPESSLSEAVIRVILIKATTRLVLVDNKPMDFLHANINPTAI